MKKFTTFCLVLITCLLGAGSSFAQSAEGLTYLTENYAPFNFVDDGTKQGISIDLLEKVFQQMGVNKTRADIQVLPWAKAYATVQDTPQTVLFAMTRTKTREPLFKWAGPIAPNRSVLIARKADGIKIGSYADVGKYKVGVVRNNVNEQLLLENGVPKSAIDETSSVDANMKKIDRGRIDLWATSEMVSFYGLKKAGYDTNAYESVFVQKEGQLYYAFHKDTDDALVQKFQKAIDAVKASADFQKIMTRYGM